MAGTIEILAGDFKPSSYNDARLGEFNLRSEGRRSGERIPYSDIIELEVASEESVNRMGGTVGWGLAGGAILGPIGLLAGALAGGRGQDTIFLCKLSDGRKFMARSSTKTYTEIQAGFLFKNDNRKLREKSTRDLKTAKIGCSVVATIFVVGMILATQLPAWLAERDSSPVEQRVDFQSITARKLRSIPTDVLYAETRALPASDFEGNLLGYRELARREPENDLYKQKVAHYEAKKRSSDRDPLMVPKQLDPTRIVKGWKQIGLKVEVPWRRSNYPTDDYTYISQCRGYVGPKGPSGFETEVTCELFGHRSTTAHQVMVGIELWNPRTATEGQALAIRAIEAIGEEVPATVIEAFRDGRSMASGPWEVVNESSNTLKEILVYYRPTNSE